MMASTAEDPLQFLNKHLIFDRLLGGKKGKSHFYCFISLVLFPISHDEIFIFVSSQYRTLTLWRQKAAGRLACTQGARLSPPPEL